MGGAATRASRVKIYAGLPGSPRPAKRSAAEGVERLLSTAFRFFPRFECMRLRRFQVLRVFEAMAGRFLAGWTCAVKHCLASGMQPYTRVAVTTPGIPWMVRRTVFS